MPRRDLSPWLILPDHTPPLRVSLSISVPSIPEVQDPTQDSLFDTDGPHFRKDEFECAPVNHPDFDYFFVLQRMLVYVTKERSLSSIRLCFLMGRV